MKKLVLIHGAWHGSWCWFRVIPKLKKVYDIININLPSHGIDREDPGQVTLETYVNHALTAIGTDNVSVIAHSMGGLVLSMLCEAIPNQIENAIYLSAFASESGKCMLDYAKIDTDSIVGKNLIVDEDNRIVDVNRVFLKDCFYNNCHDRYSELGAELLTVNPLIPFVTPLTLGENYDSVNKYYISTYFDHAISIEIQKLMIEKSNFKREYEMLSDHSSFFNRPGVLVKIIKKIVEGKR